MVSVSTWPMGRNWVYRATITNDGANSGNHVYDVAVALGNEFRILYGEIFNGDGSARTAQVYVTTSVAAEPAGRLTPRNQNLGAGAGQGFPLSGGVGADNGPGGREWLVAGTQTVRAQINSIAVSQDTAFTITCRVKAQAPTVTLTSPTDAVEVVQESAFFV